MPSIVEIFDDLAFDVERYEVHHPTAYRKYPGYHAMLGQPEQYLRGPYIGWCNFYPLTHSDMVEGSSVYEYDEQRIARFRREANPYIELLPSPWRVALMCMTPNGFSEVKAIFPRN